MITAGNLYFAPGGEMPRVRKRKAGPEQTKETKESKEVSSPPYASLTQNSDGRFVPQFTKKQKISKASKLPLLANDDESGGNESEGLESNLEANVIESCTIVANTAESTLEVKVRLVLPIAISC